MNSVVEGVILESDNPLSYEETDGETSVPPYDGVDADSLNGHAAADFLLKTEAVSLYAPMSHTHTTSQVTGLDTALAGKAAISHTHTTAQVTGLDTALAGKAAASHTHAASQVTAGTLGGSVVAQAAAVANLGTKQVRNIYAGTTSMTEGSSALPAGDIYLVYE